MFDVAPTELLLIAVVALVVIGPKDLPKAMRFVGHWVGKARGVARQFRSGFDSMVREAELHDMEKKWAEENARIMREHPHGKPSMMLPDPEGAATAVDHEDAGPVMVEQPVVAPADEPALAPRKPRVRKAPETVEAAPPVAKAPHKPRARKADPEAAS